MKLYTIDFGWEGGAAVIAESKEKAIELFKSHFGDTISHEHLNPIQEHEPNTVVEFLGDR